MIRLLWQRVARKGLTAARIVSETASILGRSGPRQALVHLGHTLASVLRQWARERQRLPGREDAFDQRTGYDTSGIIRVAALRTVSANWLWGTYYRATDEKTFTKLMSALDLEWGNFVFVDCGHGKGRVILMATRFPFNRIEGVEFSPELHRIAVSNVARLRAASKTIPEIKLFCMDILDYELPPDPLLLYMFHPFERPVMERFRRKVEDDLERKPRPLAVAYVAPRCAEVWDSSHVFVRRLEGPNWKVWLTWPDE